MYVSTWYRKQEYKVLYCGLPEIVNVTEIHIIN